MPSHTVTVLNVPHDYAPSFQHGTLTYCDSAEWMDDAVKQALDKCVNVVSKCLGNGLLIF